MKYAVEIYESFNLYEEAFRFICRLALTEDEDYMELALEYVDRFKFELSDELEDTLSEWGYL